MQMCCLMLTSETLFPFQKISTFSGHISDLRQSNSISSIKCGELVKHHPESEIIFYKNIKMNKCLHCIFFLQKIHFNLLLTEEQVVTCLKKLVIFVIFRD